MFGNLLSKALNLFKPKPAPKPAAPKQFMTPAPTNRGLPQTPMVGMSTPQGAVNVLTGQRVQTPPKPSAPKQTPTPIKKTSNESKFTQTLKNIVSSVPSPVRQVHAQGSTQGTSEFMSPKPTPPPPARDTFLNSFRQGLGDIIDRVGTKTNPGFDFGLSEMVAGGPTVNTGREGLLFDINNAQQPFTYPFGSQGPQGEDLQRQNPYYQLNTQLQNMQFGGAGSGSRNLDQPAAQPQQQGGSWGSGSVAPTVAGIAQGGPDAYDEAANIFMQSAGDDQRYIEEQKAFETERIQNEIARLEESMANLGEDERLAAQRQINELNDLRRNLTEEGAATKDSIENYFGKQMRGRATARDLDMQRMQNMFAGLGTLDSSAFQENVGALMSDASSDISGLKDTMGREISGVDRQLLQASEDTNRRVTAVQDNLNKTIRDINAETRWSRQEKEEAIKEVSMEAMRILNDVRGQQRNFLAQLPLMRRQDNMQMDMARMQAQAGAGQQGAQPEWVAALEQLQQLGGDPNAYPIASSATHQGGQNYSDGTVRDQNGNVVGRWR
jgi:hypothetical protein